MRVNRLSQLIHQCVFWIYKGIKMYLGTIQYAYCSSWPSTSVFKGLCIKNMYKNIMISNLASYSSVFYYLIILLYLVWESTVLWYKDDADSNETNSQHHPFSISLFSKRKPKKSLILFNIIQKKRYIIKITKTKYFLK